MSQTSGGRRRWFQFTLRGLILFVALVGAAAAWIGYQRRESQREAPIAEQLRNQGAYVAFVGPFLRPDEYGPDVKPGVVPAWWRQGLSDLCGPRIRMFHWSSQSTTSSNVYFVNNQAKHFNFSAYPRFDLAPLAELSRLDDVGVHFHSIDDLSPLADLSQLRNLNLSHTGVSELGPLARLTQLETLDLTYTRVHDLAPLAKLTRLKQLFLPYATLVRDITPLAGLHNL
ncbi:MAG TPA: leucine-rich repeat domain-containing protein, partial [Pirellulales bacterium]